MAENAYGRLIRDLLAEFVVCADGDQVEMAHAGYCRWSTQFDDEQQPITLTALIDVALCHRCLPLLIRGQGT